jgi:hypothetical protein
MLTFDPAFHSDGVLGCVLWADETVMRRVRFDIGPNILEDVLHDTDRGKPLVTFGYETQEEAEAAAQQVKAAVERAVLVRPFALT